LMQPAADAEDVPSEASNNAAPIKRNDFIMQLPTVGPQRSVVPCVPLWRTGNDRQAMINFQANRGRRAGRETFALYPQPYPQELCLVQGTFVSVFRFSRFLLKRSETGIHSERLPLVKSAVVPTLRAWVSTDGPDAGRRELVGFRRR
jgi:hypothetical protein